MVSTMDWKTDILVSCDWYAASLMLHTTITQEDDFRLPSGYHVQLMGNTAVWANRYYILDEMGNKLATFLCNPRSPKIDARRAMLEVANQCLYVTTFVDILDMLLCSVPCHVTGMNRVDLCGDFEMTTERWAIIRDLEIGHAYLKGLRRGVIWWSADNERRTPHQLSWGGKESTFHWKVYNKYKELHEGGSPLASKPYIEEMWRMGGLTPERVWRLEVSITSTNGLEDVFGHKIDYIDWWEKRDKLYTKIYGDKFVIRANEGHKDRRNDPVMQFLNIGEDVKFLKKSKPKTTMESDDERRVVCKMWKEYTDVGVQCNRELHSAIRDFLIEMFQYERNLNTVSRRYGLTVPEIIALVE